MFYMKPQLTLYSSGILGCLCWILRSVVDIYLSKSSPELSLSSFHLWLIYRRKKYDLIQIQLQHIYFIHFTTHEVKQQESRIQTVPYTLKTEIQAWKDECWLKNWVKNSLWEMTWCRFRRNHQVHLFCFVLFFPTKNLKMGQAAEICVKWVSWF